MLESYNVGMRIEEVQHLHGNNFLYDTFSY